MSVLCLCQKTTQTIISTATCSRSTIRCSRTRWRDIILGLCGVWSCPDHISTQSPFGGNSFPRTRELIKRQPPLQGGTSSASFCSNRQPMEAKGSDGLQRVWTRTKKEHDTNGAWQNKTWKMRNAEMEPSGIQTIQKLCNCQRFGSRKSQLLKLFIAQKQQRRQRTTRCFVVIFVNNLIRLWNVKVKLTCRQMDFLVRKKEKSFSNTIKG